MTVRRCSLPAALAALALASNASSSTALAVPEVMQPAPAIALPALESAGAPVSLAALRGRVIYVDFWASWCASCVISMPALQRLQRVHDGQPFVLLSVNTDRDRAAGQAFLRKLGLDRSATSEAAGWDPAGRTLAAYGVQGLPTGVLIDAQGLVRARVVGFRPGDDAGLGALVDQLLREQALGIVRRPDAPQKTGPQNNATHNNAPQGDGPQRGE